MESLIHSAYFSSDLLKRSSHYHDCHQLLLILKGEVLIRLAGEEYRAGPGHIALFSRYEQHSVEVLSSEYERYILRLRPSAAGEGGRVFGLLSNRPRGFRHILDISAELEKFMALFEAIIRESDQNSPFAGEMAYSLINTLLILLYRRFPVSAPAEGEKYELILALQRRFEKDPRADYSLESLASEYHISPSTLSHQFKEITGTSVMGYLLDCRIAAAKQYLSHSRMSVSEIVEKCGFSDSSNFSRTFKKMTGTTPSEFRRINS